MGANSFAAAVRVCLTTLALGFGLLSVVRSDIANAQGCTGTAQQIGQTEVRYTYTIGRGTTCQQMFPANNGNSGGDQSNPGCGQLTSDVNGWFYVANGNVCTDSFTFNVVLNDGSIATYDFVINVR